MLNHIEHALRLVLITIGAVWGWSRLYVAGRWLWRRYKASRVKAPRLFFVAAWGDDDKNPGTSELPFKTNA